ncbi:MAG TPA: BLUF domain-containing protein [Terrimicrobiaceae bacterium]|nr:BLUF domain-containing protein [Terrimicrobiaceae bacterium]
MSNNTTNAVHRIVYLSRASPGLDENAVDQLVQSARKKNARLGITGVLFFERGHFLQVLEGGREDIQVLFQKIRSDERHSGLQLLVEDDLESRQFGSWSLAWTRDNNAILSERFSELKKSVASPCPEDLAMIHKFLVVLHDCLPKVDRVGRME